MSFVTSSSVKRDRRLESHTHAMRRSLAYLLCKLLEWGEEQRLLQVTRASMEEMEQQKSLSDEVSVIFVANSENIESDMLGFV